jgi:hypothetical protein
MPTDALIASSYRLAGDRPNPYRDFAGDAIFRVSVGPGDPQDLPEDLDRVPVRRDHGGHADGGYQVSGRGFICLFYGGTGSSWLLNTLGTSPEVVIPAYEPLEWMHWDADDATKQAWVDVALDVPDYADERAVASWKAELRASPQFVDFDPKPFRVSGFKMTPEAVSDVDSLLSTVDARDGKLLAIGRRDRVKHALSLYRAHEEDKHQFHGQGLLPPTRVKRRLFSKWLRYSRRVHNALTAFTEVGRRLGPGQQLTIDYEDFVTDGGKTVTIDRVARFLGVDPGSMRWSTYRKATPDDLATAVENYAELERWLRRRRLKRILVD